MGRAATASKALAPVITACRLEESRQTGEEERGLSVRAGVRVEKACAPPLRERSRVERRSEWSCIGSPREEGRACLKEGSSLE